MEDNGLMTYDDVIKWKHFPSYFVRGIHRLPVVSPQKGQWRRDLILSLICAWTNDWANYLVAGDLRRHRAHYNVTVMLNSLPRGTLGQTPKFYQGVGNTLRGRPELSAWVEGLVVRQPQTDVLVDHMTCWVYFRKSFPIRASAAMLLALFSWNIPVCAAERLMYCGKYQQTLFGVHNWLSHWWWAINSKLSVSHKLWRRHCYEADIANYITRARLGRVTPLGRPKSICTRATLNAVPWNS